MRGSTVRFTGPVDRLRRDQQVGREITPNARFKMRRGWFRQLRIATIPLTEPTQWEDRAGC
jgi:hypothetical protein